ncbi:MAG: tetratricopeptide repeat protein [Xanthomonadales bacterium]|nr:tetratricopeptide repeat protein [Gammaproteobacteria bacterium]MBT8049808.1 tetratricopeptide repeat protein [Gammaproteobacteria bacterium]NNJ78852.1 tetratricopeptide repeat protein [Xanthomonadales bacterium]NNL03866.1 tetratricopeptide repeat protein [Xanthomonadales bacterium]
MTQYLSKFVVALVTGVLLIGSSTPLLAQSGDKERERKTKETVAMSQQVYEQLTELQELIEAQDYAQAEVKVRDLRNKKGLSDYERAQIWNITAYSYYLQERYSDAIDAYDQVLAQPDLPAALQQSTLKTKSQLMFTQEDYEGALVVIRELMAVIPEPSADVLMIEGQALFQLARYDEALVPIKTAITMYRDQGQKPKENWLLLLRVIYFEQKDYEKMLDVVKELIAYYPKDTYILVLAGIYSELGDTKKQLTLSEVLYEKGYLNNASQVTNLANLYLLHGQPYKAAVLLQTEIDKEVVKSNERNLRLLSQAWYTAREDEKAIPPLERAAAIAGDGELYIRLTQSHINLENWSEAAAAARRGIEVGGLKRTDQAHIMLGMALFNQKKLEQARGAFQRAGRDNRSARTSSQWINYVDSEIKRRDLMRQEVPNYQPRERDELLDVIEGGTN